MKYLLSILGCITFSYNIIYAQKTPSDYSGEVIKENYQRGVIPASHAPGDLEAKFRDGDIGLSDLVPIILYWIKWMLEILGSIAVLMVIIAGGQYMYGGASDDKEMGKKTFLNACLGVIVALLSWFIVDVVQKIITSGIS